MPKLQNFAKSGHTVSFRAFFSAPNVTKISNPLQTSFKLTQVLGLKEVSNAKILCVRLFSWMQTSRRSKLHWDTFRSTFSARKFRSTFFLKNGPIPASFSVYFRLFNTSQFIFKFELIKAWMVCLGFEPMAEGWQAYTNPLSYGGIPRSSLTSNKYFAF